MESTAIPETDHELNVLRDALRQFALERDWDQFHSPKNLAAALTVEAGELLEHFQWLRNGGPDEVNSQKLGEISDELADVLLYLVRIADKLDVNLIDAAHRKLKKNAEKYPAQKARGSNRKYTEL